MATDMGFFGKLPGYGDFIELEKSAKESQQRGKRAVVNLGVPGDERCEHGVLNLSGSHPLADYLSISWAVDNLFDNTWAPHVSRANTDPFNPEAVRVNEPGRTLRAAYKPFSCA